MRIGELAALKWEDVLGDRIIIHGQHLKTTAMKDDLTFAPMEWENVDHVKSHTSAGIRQIMLVDGAREIIERARSIRNGSEYVFSFKGKQFSHKYI